MKYFIYVRKSSEDKKKQVQSIDDQLAVLTVMAGFKGYDVIGVIKDEKSARKPGRIGFQELIERISAHEGTGILCWKLDRLSRNPVDAGQIMWLLQQKIIEQIVTPDRSYTPADHSVTLSVELGSATQFIRDQQTNVCRGMESKMRKGWMPTKAPIGYVNDRYGIKGDKRIFPDEKYFPVIQALWKKLLRDQCSLMDLYRYMCDETPIYTERQFRGIKKERLMGFSVFARLFRSKFYCGLFSWHGEHVVGAHKPMITQREFEEAQTIIDSKKKLRRRGLQFDLKGLFHCGECKALLTAEQHKKILKHTGEEKTYAYYRCGHRKRNTECREKPLSESSIERFILNEIEQLSVPQEILEFGLQMLKKKFTEMPVSSPKEMHLQREIAKLDGRIKNLEENLPEESDVEIRLSMKKRSRELAVEKRALEEELQTEHNAWRKPHVDIANRIELILHAKEAFTRGTSEQRQRIIRGLGSNWIAKSQTLSYEPHFVPQAVRNVKKRLRTGKGRFEPIAARIESGRSLTSEHVALIWSGWRESNPRHQVGNLR